MNLDREMNSYLNEKETIETRIDSLKNDKRKLLREVSFNLKLIAFWAIKTQFFFSKIKTLVKRC